MCYFCAIIILKGGIALKERIKVLRTALKMTQTEFADRLGVKQNTVAAWECGARVPSDSITMSICREFDINRDWLVNGVEPMKKPADMLPMAHFARIMSGDNEFAKAFFAELVDMPEEFWRMAGDLFDRVSETIKKKDR